MYLYVLVAGVSHLGSAVVSSMHLTNQGEQTTDTTSTANQDHQLHNAYKLPSTEALYYPVSIVTAWASCILKL